MIDRPEETRALFVRSGALACATALVWFLAPALSRARGAPWSLAMVGLIGLQTALVNRLGRPLPPDQVALRLTLVAAALWITSELLGRHGQRLAERLDNPAEGGRYPTIPDAGLLGVGAVLLLDAWQVGSGGPLALATTPPLMALGASLALLLARRRRSWLAFHGALAAFLGGAALVGAQRAVLGPRSLLEAGRWLPVGLPGVGVMGHLARIPFQTGALLGLGPETTALALGFALLAALIHGGTRALRTGELRGGAGWGRDGLLLATFGLASWRMLRVSGAGVDVPGGATAAGVLALLAVGMISTHAAWKEASARHVYFVQRALGRFRARLATWE
jgi:hypothetical protein